MIIRGPDTGKDTGEAVSRTLVQAIQGEIEYLRRESERKDVIIINLTNKIPQLAPPQQEEQPKLPWWKRMFKRYGSS